MAVTILVVCTGKKPPVEGKPCLLVGSMGAIRYCGVSLYGCDGSLSGIEGTECVGSRVGTSRVVVE